MWKRIVFCHWWIRLLFRFKVWPASHFRPTTRQAPCVSLCYIRLHHVLNFTQQILRIMQCWKTNRGGSGVANEERASEKESQMQHLQLKHGTTSSKRRRPRTLVSWIYLTLFFFLNGFFIRILTVIQFGLYIPMSKYGRKLSPKLNWVSL